MDIEVRPGLFMIVLISNIGGVGPWQRNVLSECYWISVMWSKLDCYIVLLAIGKGICMCILAINQ